MSSRFKKYIIKKPVEMEKTYEVMDGPDVVTPLLLMDSSIRKGAFYMECTWFHKPIFHAAWRKTIFAVIKRIKIGGSVLPLLPALNASVKVDDFGWAEFVFAEETYQLGIVPADQCV